MKIAVLRCPHGTFQISDVDLCIILAFQRLCIMATVSNYATAELYRAQRISPLSVFSQKFSTDKDFLLLFNRKYLATVAVILCCGTKALFS